MKINKKKVIKIFFSVQIDVAPGQNLLMAGGGLPGTFIMDQMHFHWSSEHTINNERYRHIR